MIRHLADTPFFVDSRASRVNQLADHVAYAVFRRYHARDDGSRDDLAAVVLGFARYLPPPEAPRGRMRYRNHPSDRCQLRFT